MSGGHFNYDQNRIGYIADEIEIEIERNGRGPQTRQEYIEETWLDDEDYEEYLENFNDYKHSDAVIEKFKEAVKILRMAEVYAQRVDWYLSGDDGEESFLERLNKELTKYSDEK